MESFGPFEAGRVLDSGDGATVYEARKEGDAKGRYVIKVFSPERLVAEEEPLTRSELDPLFQDLGAAFSTRVNLQKKAAESSRAFASILAAGQDQRGAWYASHFYARSAKGMLERFIALEPPDLFHIIDSVVRGALHLKRTAGRSHGNLKPANIFLEGLRRPRSSRVVLTDPLAGGETDAEGFERADLRAIGELLYQFVMKRKVDFAWVMVPIESSPDWTRVFGKATASWLELCNRLLDPQLSLDRTTLEIIEKELRKLRPKPPIPVAPIAIGAGVVIITGLIAFFVLHKRTSGTLVVHTDPAGSQVVLIPVDADGNEDLGHTTTNVTGLDGGMKRSLEKGPYKLKVEYRSPLGELEASRRLPLTIEPGKTFRTNVSLMYGGLLVRSEPPGAEFTINQQTWRTPFTNAFAHPAELELQLRLEGYETTNFNVTIPSNHAMVELFARLRKPPPGSSLVDLTSDPSGAELFLDGASVGKAPRRIAIEVGQHEIAAELPPWFARQSRTLEVRKDQGQTEAFYFPHGMLSVSNTTPAVVQVFLNDRSAGLSPTNLSLPPGSYTLALRAEGYETNVQMVGVSDKGIHTPTAVLKALAGFVELTSDPPGAEVRDETNRVLAVTGADGTARIPLAPGTYSLKLTFGDLAPLDKPAILIKAGQFTRLGKVTFDYGAALFDVQPVDAQTNATIQRADQKRVAIGQTVYQRPGDNVSYHIAAPGYEPDSTNIILAVNQTRRIGFRLSRQTVPVKLASNPPGLRFYNGSDTELKLSGQNYLLPWGSQEIIARHPRLGARTNTVAITLAGQNTVPSFDFLYGTLVLTNLPKDIAVLEGNATVGTPADKIVYEPLGTHSYTLRGRFRSETVLTNILGGVNYLQSTAPKSILSSIGMELVQSHALSAAKGEIYVGKFEVTQADYSKVMSSNPSSSHGDTLPVSNVSPQNAVDFCKKLSDLDKTAPGFPEGYVYTLPTVAQWESLSAGVDPGLGVFSSDETHRLTVPVAVGSKGADGNGLCDLLGNVWEICLDPVRGGYRMRGGSCFETARGFRVTFQDAVTQPSPYIGFRVLLAPSGP